MRCSNELRDYENGLPPKIKIERIYDMVNPSGTFVVEFQNYAGEKFGGTINDEDILKVLKDYTPFYGEKEYTANLDQNP